MTLRVPGDPDPGERAAHLVQPLQQRQRAVERPGRVRGVPTRHEHVVHAAGLQSADDLGQVLLAGHRTGSQVRHDLVAAGGQPLSELYGRVQALDRRRGDGHGHPGRHPVQHRPFGAPGRDHLVPRAAQQRLQTAHGASSRRARHPSTPCRATGRSHGPQESVLASRYRMASHKASSTSRESSRSSRDTPVSIRVSGSPNIAATRSASAVSAGEGSCASQTSRR